MASPLLIRVYFLGILRLVVFLPCLFSLRHVAAQSSGRWEDGMLQWRRLMEEQVSATNALSANLSISIDDPPIILAAERTRRIDPRNNSNYYTGGWNISDEHYISSIAFTALPLVSIGVVWFIGFGLALLLACCFSCFCRRRQQRRSNSFSQSWHLLSFILLILLAGVAIAGCIVLYTAHAKSRDISMSALDYMKDQSDFIVENLQNLARKMAGAEKMGIDKLFLSTDLQVKVEEISTKLNRSSQEISTQTLESYDTLKEIIKLFQIYLAITAAVILLLTFIGLLFSMLGLQFPVYLLALLGWILVTAAFILCGLFLVMHNIVGDTCAALAEWSANPHANTVLRGSIPCVDSQTATESLSRSKEVTFQLITAINGATANISNHHFSRRVRPPLNYNQSGPLVPLLCNPYGPDLKDRACHNGEVTFDNASEVWKGFVCNATQVSGTEICSTVGRLTPTGYADMTAAASLSHALHQFTPFLTKVADCTFALETLSSIATNYCPGLEHSTKLIYAGFTTQTAALMLSLVFWLVFVVQRKELKNGKNSTTQEGPHIAGYKL